MPGSLTGGALAKLCFRLVGLACREAQTQNVLFAREVSCVNSRGSRAVLCPFGRLTQLRIARKGARMLVVVPVSFVACQMSLKESAPEPGEAAGAGYRYNPSRITQRPADGGDSAAFSSFFLRPSGILPSSRIHTLPTAAEPIRWAALTEASS
jgi:hypothetical protein